MPNIVILSGRLTRDPEVTHATTGMSVCKFSIAFDDGYGERKKTVYKDCTAFGKTAEFVGQYFTKGKSICVTGSMTEDRWTDKATGKERSKTAIRVDKAEFFGFDKPKDDDQREEQPAPRPARPAPPRHQPMGDDDMPF